MTTIVRPIIGEEYLVGPKKYAMHYAGNAGNPIIFHLFARIIKGKFIEEIIIRNSNLNCNGSEVYDSSENYSKVYTNLNLGRRLLN